MLILIAGVSGNLGQLLASSALSRGHTVRGLGRSITSIPSALLPKLESFVPITSYSEDIPALDKACSGVDAVICAYSYTSPLSPLDSQLLLLRAAERAGIKRFHALSWNLDWTQLDLGEFPGYDPYIIFKRAAEMTSSIKPLYTQIGAFAETFFFTSGYEVLADRDTAPWDVKTKAFKVIGTGDEMFEWTTLGDAAEFTVELVVSDKAEDGGVYYFRSGKDSFSTLQKAYKAAKGKEAGWVKSMSLDEVKAAVEKGKREIPDNEYWRYVGAMYALYMFGGERGKNLRDDGNLFPGVKKTSAETFFREHDEL
jgi:hypothetical protein